MSCCGNKSKVTAVKKIIKGYTGHVLAKYVTGDSHAAMERVDVCKECDDNTYLTKRQYIAWLAANGIEVLTHIDDLTRLPMLDKHPFKPGRSLFCRQCKCWIPAKAYSKDSQCPQDKWAD